MRSIIHTLQQQHNRCVSLYDILRRKARVGSNPKTRCNFRCNPWCLAPTSGLVQHHLYDPIWVCPSTVAPTNHPILAIIRETFWWYTILGQTHMRSYYECIHDAIPCRWGWVFFLIWTPAFFRMGPAIDMGWLGLPRHVWTSQ